MSQASPPSTRPFLRLPSCALALFLLFGFPVGVAAEGSVGLEAALQARDQGRSLAALAILEQLRQASPESARLALESAVVHIQLRQYDSAERLLENVLANPDLPSKVRVNTQLLLLKTRRLKQRQRDDAFDLMIDAGVAYRHTPSDSYSLLDSRLGVRYGLALPPLDVAGRPLFTQWVGQLDVYSLYFPDTGVTDTRAEISTGIEFGGRGYRLLPALIYRLDEDGSGPGGSLTTQWTPSPLVSLNGQLSYLRSSSGDSEHFRSARIRLFHERPIHWALGYRELFNIASEDTDVEHSQVLTELSYRNKGSLTLGFEYRLKGPDPGPRSAFYLRGDRPLRGGFTLRTEVRYLDYTGNDLGGYGRLGVSWRK